MSAIKNKAPFVSILIGREIMDENGLWNPPDKDDPIKGAFQVNMMGTREHYLRLADFLRDFAQKGTSKDCDYHEHFEGILSADGKVRFHVILRKDDVGDSMFKKWYPKPNKKR